MAQKVSAEGWRWWSATTGATMREFSITTTNQTEKTNRKTGISVFERFPNPKKSELGEVVSFSCSSFLHELFLMRR